MKKMATMVSIVVLALLLTGVATTAVYVLPIMSQGTAAQASNEEGIQTQAHQQIRDREQRGHRTQLQDRFHFRGAFQHCKGSK